MSTSFDIAGFQADLERTRSARGVQWKQVSKATGVSASTLSRMKNGRNPDAASMAALCAWAGLDHRKYIAPEPEKPKLDTGLLMSSLREMVTADVHLQMIGANVLKTSPEHLTLLQEQYSRHERVVREQLLMLGAAASAYKPPVRFR